MKKFLVALTLALVLALGCVVIASAEPAPMAVNENAIVAYGDIGSITKVGGHNVVQATTVEELFAYTPATCTEYGVAYFKCKDTDIHEGDPLHAVQIAKKDHDWKEVEKVTATCTTDGTSRLVCKVCGTEGNLITVPATGHTFTKKLAYYYEPTCEKAGYAYRLCDVCGAKDPLAKDAPKDYKEAQNAGYEYPYNVNGKATGYGFNAAKGWVEVPETKHTYTDWTYSKISNCWDFGKATKTCIKCGDVQYVDGTAGTLVPINKKYEIVKETDEDFWTWYPLNNVMKDIVPKNRHWFEADNIIADEYDNYTDLNKDLAEALKIAQIEFKSDVWKNCNEREVTYVCPLCKSEKDAKGRVAHPAIVVKMNVESHVWNEKAQASKELKKDGKYLTVEDYKAMPGAIGLIEAKAADLRKIYMAAGIAGEKDSVAPNCVLPGYTLTLCKYDDVHGHEEDTEYQLTYLFNTGHDWEPWKTVETYTLNGKNYKVQTHICKTCKAEEHETVEYTPDPAKNGLILEGDVFNYYKDGEIQSDFTGVVDYDGQKFYVVDGKDDCKKTGLTLIDNQFVYLIENRLATEVNQVVLYDGEWFKVVNGVLDTKMPAGLYDYDGGKFIFAAGRLINDYTGLWLNPLDNDWYYIKAGSGFDSSFTGETVYDGVTFQVVNGKLAK